MDYEKPFNDDRPMTVGDARMLKQYIASGTCLAGAFSTLVIATLGKLAGSSLVFLWGCLASAFLLFVVWAVSTDGYARSILEFFTDEVAYPPIFDDAYDFGTDRSRSARGDD